MATFVYVGNTESNDVWVLRLDRDSGALSPVEKVPIPAVSEVGTSTPMAVTPDRRFLYAATRGEPKIVAGFAIDPTHGTLKHVASGPLDGSMAYIATDRTGAFLFAASYPGNKLTVSRITPPGTVQPPHQVIENQPNAHSILPDPTNRHVVAATLGNDLVNIFSFDANAGTLAPHATLLVDEKAGPRHFRFHPGGKHIYVLGERDAAVYVFDYEARPRRAKQRISALPPGFDGGPIAADIHLTPDGKFLYASERASNTLAAFRVDPETGMLAAIGSVPTEAKPRAFAIDPAGRYLLAVGQQSHAMSIYRIEASGALTKLASYPMGKNPSWVEILDLP